MDVAQSMETSSGEAIKCIDMHTTGEPTRIVYSGFPRLEGTLLDQRDQARNEYDHLRKRLMLEPRGHFDMYGAIIIQDTELVRNGTADIGVLFTTNSGYSTMCGHATIALGRFLVDTHDLTVFPKRDGLVWDQASRQITLNIHAPCGLVSVQVPTTADGRKSDPSRQVGFLSSPAYPVAMGLTIPIPKEVRWPELGDRESVTLDISYGGAFYALIPARELGFDQGLGRVDLASMTSAVKRLKPYLSSHAEVVQALRHAEDERLSFLYSVMVVDDTVGSKPPGVEGTETGLCIFADNQIDRSPTGSCVTARMALAHAKGNRPVGQRWAYNSLVSNHFNEGAFTATIYDDKVHVTEFNGNVRPAVIVRVEGSAFYTGAMTFIVEEEDVTGQSGFTMEGVTK
ncbi:hypothetical protein FE257_008568 [Aspergillus nanangensis]|uniref:trans-L-3-hydroxyproline dehydratase n=1 Tax=Aspergillus nanangensis TaxID=2582783 RepID=A0AAD4GTB5_ASPNN|nr:hypothetical protein FE257_008568 [Aspergillus nanangensis]